MSTAGVLDLWSDDIRVNVLTPVAILRTQVSALSRKAEGILRAEVRSEIEQKKVEHHLVLIAPALNDFQVTLLRTTHDAEFVYPAMVKSRGLLPEKPQKVRIHPLPPSLLEATFAAIGGASVPPEVAPDERVANTQEEFIVIIGEILKSGWVRSLTQSLIARSNDALAEKKERNGSSENSPSTSQE